MIASKLPELGGRHVRVTPQTSEGSKSAGTLILGF